MGTRDCGSAVTRLSSCSLNSSSEKQTTARLEDLDRTGEEGEIVVLARRTERASS